MSAVSFVLVRTSYAGVSDEGAVQAGVAAFPDYLRRVTWAIVMLSATEVLALFATTSGLVALLAGLRWPGGAEARNDSVTALGAPAGPSLTVLVRWLAMAMLVHLVAWGAEARRHPGLFLPLLSASRAAAPWLSLSQFLWPAILVASAVGWARFVPKSRHAAEALAGALGAMIAVAWLAVFELRELPGAGAAPLAARVERPATLRRYPNVLLLGVDSLRPDKIDPVATPHLARLCRESVYFPNALVTLPRTAPSWTALLTSLPPLANGVETMFPTAARSQLAALAMPAHLASLGYATTVISEYAGESFGRMSLGFQRQSVPRVELEQILGQGFLGRQPLALGLAGLLYTGPRALLPLLPAPLPELMRGLASFSHPSVLADDLTSQVDPARPWFALVFYSQPHFPYTSSSPFDGTSTVAAADPALRFGKDVTHGDVRTAADRAQIDALYRTALAQTDAALGDLLARLDSSGHLEDTIVVLTADHGEGLYECPTCIGHGDNLHGMMSLRVPLAFRLPRRRFPSAEPTTIAAYVSQLDVYPTLLTLLDTARPPVQEGIALLTGHGAPVTPPADRIFFAETGEWLWPTPAVPSGRIAYPPITGLARIEQGRIVIEEPFLPVIRAAKHRMAFLPPFKLLYAPKKGGVEWRLYDIERDPSEEHDVTGRHPDVAERLRAALRHSVLRFSHMLPVEDFFLTRPAALPEEYY
ncbi:MAG TPA: sulfatase-like hydrolase/transferase [Polyangiaceae bacterium]|nr:sulfatase-like hydrolase/transferase [Polyangiaceae bacterium]